MIRESLSFSYNNIVVNDIRIKVRRHKRLTNYLSLHHHPGLDQPPKKVKWEVSLVFEIINEVVNESCIYIGINDV